MSPELPELTEMPPARGIYSDMSPELHVLGVELRATDHNHRAGTSHTSVPVALMVTGSGRTGLIRELPYLFWHAQDQLALV